MNAGREAAARANKLKTTKKETMGSVISEKDRHLLQEARPKLLGFVEIQRSDLLAELCRRNVLTEMQKEDIQVYITYHFLECTKYNPNTCKVRVTLEKTLLNALMAIRYFPGKSDSKTTSGCVAGLPQKR